MTNTLQFFIKVCFFYSLFSELMADTLNFVGADPDVNAAERFLGEDDFAVCALVKIYNFL